MRRQDFSVYYSSAMSLRLGHDPYTESFKDIADRLGVQLNGQEMVLETPTFLLCFEPLTRLSVPRSYWLWIGLNVACLAITLWLLLGVRSALSKSTALILAAIALLYPPITTHFGFAQSQIVVMFLLVSMMRLLERRYDASAGLLLSLAALLRAYPLFLVGYLLVNRRVRAAAFTFLGLTIGGILTIIAVGPARVFSFLVAVGLVRSSAFLSIAALRTLPAAFVHAPDNGSIQNLVFMFFELLGDSWSGSFVVSIATWLIEATLIVFTVTTTMKRPATKWEEWRNFSLWIVAMIMLSPIAWTHYQVLLLIPYVSTVIAYEQANGSGRALGMSCVSYCLTVAYGAVGRAVSVLGQGFYLASPKWSPWLTFLNSMVLISAYLAVYWMAKRRSPAYNRACVRVEGDVVSSGPSARYSL